MKKLLSLLASIAIIAMVATVAASAKSPKPTETAVFTVSPQMTCQNCENKIKSNLRFEKGISAIATDLKAQTVTITFDPTKTNAEAIAGAFKKIGYDATPGAAAAAPAKACCGKKEGCSKNHGCSGCNQKHDAASCCKNAADSTKSCCKKH